MVGADHQQKRRDLPFTRKMTRGQDSRRHAVQYFKDDFLQPIFHFHTEWVLGGK
jgi:hypothetical protein